LSLSCRDHGVIEYTESHPLVGHCMMTWRTNQGVRRANYVGHDGVDRGNRATRGKTRDSVSASPDGSAHAGVSAVGLSDLAHPREVLRGVIDSQLLVGGENRVDAPHPLRDPKQIHELLRAADKDWARGMRDRFGEGIRTAILDQIETSVMREIAVIEDKTDETVPWHGCLQLVASKRYKGLTLRPMPSITFQNVMNVDQS
jgi:hypothetical protein